MTALLQVRTLEVRYGDLIGLADVSLEVPQGSVVALLGSNGAGKTTTLNAIAGLVPVHAGLCGGGARADALARGLAALHRPDRRAEPAPRRDAARRQVPHPPSARA